MTRIAIEATGCDNGFRVVLEGAREALKRDSDLELILVAGKDKLQERPRDVEVVETEHTYNPERENRQKNSSIYRAIKMHRDGEVNAVIAPGDTVGAVLYSVGLLKRIRGILRPTIPAILPYKNSLLDVGASYESEPEHLFQFAIIGRIYSQECLGVQEPLIGLMNVGAEQHKGPESVKEARKLITKLEKKGYNIADHYFEPNSFGAEYLSAGRVGLADGFLGNLILKSFETALATQYQILKKNIKDQDALRKVFAWYGIHKPVKKLKKDFDYREYATCPLLGVKGSVMICHGRSDAEAIANAIRATKNYLKCNINSRVEEEIAKYGVAE